MRIQRSIRHRGPFALFAVASLLLVTASPAQATETLAGAGSGFGGEYPVERPAPQPCDGNIFSDYLPSDNIDLFHTGTVIGLDSNNQETAVYTGPTKISIDLEDHYISPIGTHDDEEANANPALCFVPTNVQGKATVTSFQSPSGTVSCGPMDVEWIRVQSAVTGVLTFPGTGPGAKECKVKGNTLGLNDTVDVATAVIVVEGEQIPCTLAPTTAPNPACDVMFEAAQAAGFNQIRTDPGSMMQTTYEAGGVTP